MCHDEEPLLVALRGPAPSTPVLDIANELVAERGIRPLTANRVCFHHRPAFGRRKGTMLEYLFRIKHVSGRTEVHCVTATDLKQAASLARAFAARAGAGWSATAVNLPGHFRMKAGEMVQNPPVGRNDGDERSIATRISPLDHNAREQVSMLAWKGLELLQAGPLAALGKRLLHTALWCWTADAMIDGRYVRDRVKFDMTTLPHTAAAGRALSRRELRHEHAIPRKAVVTWLLEKHDSWATRPAHEALSDIQEVLCQCPPVIVTRREDEMLSRRFKACMPTTWKRGQSPFLRYTESGLLGDPSEIIFPEDGFWGSDGRYRMAGT